MNITSSFSLRRFMPITLLVVMAGCSKPASTPTAPSAAERGSVSSALIERPPSDRTDNGVRDPFRTLDVVFPPRDQSLRFRQELETVYRDVLRRGATSSFVDLEGTIVWTQEYLRYRVNGCTHTQATQRVMSIIDGGAIPAVCSTTSTPFPPRNEPFQFRQDLEVKYRDGLRRGPTSTFVDTEGDIVWTQEYFRFRTMSCTDAQASARVLEQVQGAPPSSNCGGFCAITISEPQVTFDERGDSRSVTITTGAGCGWTARSDSSWLTIISGASGSGTGTLRYNVAPFNSPGSREGVITVGDATIRVRQVNDPISASFVLRQGGAVVGSCNLGGSGASNCSLDGTGSRGAITSYQWNTTHFRTTGGNVSNSYSGATVNLGSISCTVQGNSSERFDVTLTVRDSSGRSSSSTQNLSFSRAGCGT